MNEFIMRLNKTNLARKTRDSNKPFTQKFLFIQPNFRMIFLIIRTKFSFELRTISYFRHWTDDHCCKNSLSSLHISIHHSTFCASLHVKTSLAMRQTETIIMISSIHCSLCLYSANQETDIMRLAKGVDFGGGQPGRTLPQIGTRPCIYQVLPYFPPKCEFANPVFLAGLRQCAWLRVSFF